MVIKITSFKALLTAMLFIMLSSPVFAQTAVGSLDGCFIARWGVDAGLYSGVIEFGNGVEPTSPPRSRDWFQGAAGDGLIDESSPLTIQTLLQTDPNPIYERRMKYPPVSPQNGQYLIDGLFARDQFGGTGGLDQTSFVQAAKNGEDPASWPTGTSNVLGKNDIVDLGAHMFRDGLSGLTDNLWFVGWVNLAEPGGSAYMDFEFYVQDVAYNTTTQKISSGGPDMGHTAYKFNHTNQTVTRIGDFVLAVNLGTSASLEARIWVSRADWVALGGGTTNAGTTTFSWTGTFDGAFNNAPFGYAGIVPKVPGIACGYVNAANEAPLAPPWGSKTSKNHNWTTTYQPKGAIEVAIDLTSIGLDHSSLSTNDPCFFPLATFMIKTRASQSFTAQLKDFGGPFSWAFGGGNVTLNLSPIDISCTNEIVTVSATPARTDLKYLWKTVGGNILNTIPLSPSYKSAHGLVVNFQGDTIAELTGDPWEIQVDKVGNYTVSVLDMTGCGNLVGGTATTPVVLDPTDPLFNGPPTITFTPPCNGNDGTLTAAVSGATPLYTFELLKDGDPTPVQTATNVATPHTFTGLDAGSYVVRVKGQSACVVTSDAVVLPLAVVPTFTPTITNLDCFGDTDGSISLGTVTGKDPLQYEWSTGAQTPNISNLAAGTYNLTITDADGCEWNYTYDIISPPAITASFVKVDDPGNNDPDDAGGGSATVTPSGGTSPYTYLWTKTGRPGYVFNPNNTSDAITNLSYGEYVVTITDDNGCSTTASVFIYEKERCDDGIDNSGNGLADCDDPVCIPAASAAITPSDPLPCVDEQVTYTATLVTGITEYVWTVPANATIISGQGTNEIEVEWQDTNGGQICVRAKNFDCLSPATCINVQVQDVPPQPNAINLNNN